MFEYDEAQAARILNVHPRTLQRYRMQNRIDHFVLPGGRIRYSAEQLTDFAGKCRRMSPHYAD